MITIQGTVPIQTVRHHYDIDDPREAVTLFMASNPDARIEKIGDDFVRGLAFCNLPVLERETDFKYDFDEKRYYCPKDRSCETCEACAAHNQNPGEAQ